MASGVASGTDTIDLDLHRLLIPIKKRQTIELSHRMSELDMRHIIIPVDVPGMHIIHSACLSLSKKPSRSNEKLGVLAIGEAIPLELTLKHSRRWSAIRALEGGKEIPLGFYYEIEANPDTWLVAGQRRAFFSATVSPNLMATSSYKLTSIVGRPSS